MHLQTENERGDEAEGEGGGEERERATSDGGKVEATSVFLSSQQTCGRYQTSGMPLLGLLCKPGPAQSSPQGPEKTEERRPNAVWACISHTRSSWTFYSWIQELNYLFMETFTKSRMEAKQDSYSHYTQVVSLIHWPP